MNKKLLETLLALTITASTAGFVTACNKEETSAVTLENFADASADVELGSVYSLASPVAYDTEGNDYRVIYTVTTESGASVSISNNQISIDRFEQYKILCTVTIGENDVRTRTLTLNVKDVGAPVIKIAEASLGYVGEEYVLPAITVSDASGEKITPAYKLFLTDGEQETEIAVQDGKFTPSSRGVYKLNVTAKDSSGNEGKESAQFFVRSALSSYVIEDFDDEYGKSTYTNKLNETTSEDEIWYEEFEGKTGVVSAKSSNQYGPHQYFKFNMTKEELAAIDFEYIYVDVYVHYDSKQGTRTKCQLYSRNTPIGDGIDFDTWTRIKITPEIIADANSFFSDPAVRGAGETPRECFNRLMTTGKGYSLFYTYDESSERDAYTFYVAEIGWKGNYSVDLQLKDEYKLGEYITLNGTVAGLEDYSLSYVVKNPSGQEVELDDENKFRLTETGEYTVTATINHETQSGERTFKFNVKSDKQFTIADFGGTAKQGEEVFVPVATMEGLTATTTVKIGNHTETITDGKFVPALYGEYTVEYSVTDNGITYRDWRTINVEKSLKENEVNSFDGADSVNDIKIHNGSNHKVEWLAEYKGETGVVKLTGNNTEWPAFTFFSAQKMIAYENYDYIVFKIFMPSDVQTYNGFNFLNVGGKAQYKSPEKGKWVEVSFDIATFKEYWKDNRADMNLTEARVFSGQTSTDLVTIYLGEIYVVKGISRADISAEFKEAENNQIELEISNSDNLNYTLKLFGPDGNEVTLNNGKFTGVPGKYEYKLTAEGFVGEKTGSYRIMATLECDVTAPAEKPKRGDEIACPEATVFVNGEVTADATVSIAVKYGNDVVELNDNKFTARYAGTYTLIYTVGYDGFTAEKTITIDVLEDGYLAQFDHAVKEAVLYTETESTKEFITAEMISADSSLPALPEGASGYLKVTGKANSWGTFAFGFTGNYFTKEMLADSDYIDVTLYFAGKNTIRGYWYNYRFFTVEPGQWTTVRMPVAMFSQTLHENRGFSSMNDFYNAIATQKLFDMYDWSMEENETMYITDARLVKETSDASLGDRYVGFTKDNWQDFVWVNSGSVEWSEEDSGLRVRAEAGKWANIYFRTGKNFSELHEYSKIRVICKNVSSDVEIFVQNNFKGSGNEYVYWTKTEAEDGSTYFELDISIFVRYYYKTKNGADETFSDDNRALLITNGNAADFCIQDIVLVK